MRRSSIHRPRIGNRYCNSNNIAQLAERIRKRATLLSKRRRDESKQILLERDELILALYASDVPPGWACAWCDGSSIKLDGQRRTGIGGILMDPGGMIIERFNRTIGEQDAFAAELAAVAAVIRVAVAQQQLRLRVYTDNFGLANLWREKRDDSRLAELRELSGKMERFSLHSIPRLHNQPANALARQAAGIHSQ